MENKKSTLTREQVLKEQAKTPNICVVCKGATWFCGGIQGHLREKKATTYRKK